MYDFCQNVRRTQTRLIPLLMLSIAPIAWTASANAQSASAVSPQTSTAQPAATVTSRSVDSVVVAELKKVQTKVARVAARNMEACVAISDGVGFGSGVVVSPEGLVLTAGHVMSTGDEGKYEIIFPSGRTVPAKPLGRNLDVDCGMLQLVGDGPWPYAEMVGAEEVQKGDWVVSLGHSGGFELGRNPPVRVGRVLRLKQDNITTDAILIGGDSGGPLFNLDAELVGIHSSIGDTIADNRHVPMSTYRRDWNRLKSGESWGQLPELNEPGDKTRKGRIGVTIDRQHPRARIKSIGKGSAAEDIGLKPGDIVTQLGNVMINDGAHLIDVVNRHHAGEVLPLKIERNGAVLSFEVQLK